MKPNGARTLDLEQVFTHGVNGELYIFSLYIYIHCSLYTCNLGSFENPRRSKEQEYYYYTATTGREHDHRKKHVWQKQRLQNTRAHFFFASLYIRIYTLRVPPSDRMIGNCRRFHSGPVCDARASGVVASRRKKSKRMARDSLTDDSYMSIRQ